MFTIEDLLEAGGKAILAEHAKNIRDTDGDYPGDKVPIHGYYDTIGWAGILAANGKHKEYNEEDEDYWCGAFAAAMLSNLNAFLGCEGEPTIGLHPKLAYYVFPSTLRLASAKKWAQAGFVKPEFVAPKNIRYGDIVCVETGEGKPEGDHVTYALSSVDKYGHFETGEGNGRGKLGDGSSGEGVVTNRRHVRVVKNIVRLTREHFIGVDYE